jgi:hypothetical protein
MAGADGGGAKGCSSHPPQLSSLVCVYTRKRVFCIQINKDGNAGTVPDTISGKTLRYSNSEIQSPNGQRKAGPSDAALPHSSIDLRFDCATAARTQRGRLGLSGSCRRCHAGYSGQRLAVLASIFPFSRSSSSKTMTGLFIRALVLHLGLCARSPALSVFWPFMQHAIMKPLPRQSGILH